MQTASPSNVLRSNPHRAQAVLADLAQRGLRVELTERHTLLITPVERIDDDLRQLIRCHRDSVIDLLMSERVAGSTEAQQDDGLGADCGSFPLVSDGQRACAIGDAESVVFSAGEAQDPAEAADGAQSAGDASEGNCGARMVLCRPAALGGETIWVASDEVIGVGFRYSAPNNRGGEEREPGRCRQVYFRSELPLIRRMAKGDLVAIHRARKALLGLWEPHAAVGLWDLVRMGKTVGLSRAATLDLVDHLLAAKLAMDWVIGSQPTYTLLRPRREVVELRFAVPSMTWQKEEDNATDFDNDLSQ